MTLPNCGLSPSLGDKINSTLSDTSTYHYFFIWFFFEIYLKGTVISKKHWQKLFFCNLKYTDSNKKRYIVDFLIIFINTQFSYKLWISDKDVDVDQPSVKWGTIYKITRLQKVNYFFSWTRCGWKLLNTWINCKVQMHHTWIVQNIETWM